MSGTCILVADGSRARLFTLDPTPPRGSVRFEERESLVEPERRLKGRETFSAAKSGRKQSPGGGAAHGTDDHRTRHREEVESRFARRIAKGAADLVRHEGRDWLIVVAEPHLLGLLRPRLDAALPSEVRRTELDGDLSAQALPTIRRALERRGILPKAAPPAGSYRPRGRLSPSVPERPAPPPRAPRHEEGRPRRHREAPPR